MLRQMLCAIALVGLGSTSAQAQFRSDTLKIGVLNDRSGIYADLSGEGSVVAAQMAVEDAGGKVAGRPIQLLSADHQNKADVGANIARQWIDRDGVSMIIDVPNSGVALAVQEITREKQIIFIASGPGSSRLIGDACSPTGFLWTYNTYAMGVGTGGAMVDRGGSSWFFITADYAFGQSMQQDTSQIVVQKGGKILGSIKHPLNTADFSSFLLQAQSSGAKVIALANAGADTTNAIKQAAEFGITHGDQQLAGLLVFDTDIDALGLATAQGLILTTGFYWDFDDQTRTWSARFEKRHGAEPTMVQAGVYSAIRHYLKAVEATGTDDGPKVAAKMRELPLDDFFARHARIEANGAVSHDMYLAQVKAPGESKGRWDYLKILSTIPGTVAFQKPENSGCKLVAP